jgi:hypothetical protein
VKPLHLHPPALTGIALILAALVIAGCGGGQSGDSGSQTYGELLGSIKHAALAKETYDGADRAKGLNGSEKAVAISFCEFAWQIPVNHEAYKLSEHSYIVSRIKGAAELAMNFKHASAIDAPLEKLRSVIDLASLNGTLTNSYKKACYG